MSTTYSMFSSVIVIWVSCLPSRRERLLQHRVPEHQRHRADRDGLHPGRYSPAVRPRRPQVRSYNRPFEISTAELPYSCC